MRGTRYLLLAILALLLAITVAAQGAPEAINVALADLNARLGTAYTLNDFNWSWEQQTYEDTSLGCPAEGQTYETMQIVGYRFEFFIGEEVYEYRTSADGSILAFCGASGLDDEEDQEEGPASEVIGSDEYTNPLCQLPPEGITYMPTRITRDIQARVTPGLPNTLRGEPDRQAATTGEIPGGAIFTITDGPICDDEGFLWWLINYDGTVGWTAEGSNGEYFLEPVPALELPVPRLQLGADRLDLVQELSRLQGNFSGAIAFAPITEGDEFASTLLAGGGLGSEGVQIYSLNNLDESLRVLSGTDVVTTIAYGTNPNVPLLGGADGALRLWNTEDGAVVVERAYLVSQNTAINAAAYSADGMRLAAAGGQAFGLGEAEENVFGINVWAVETVSQITTLRGHTAEVTSLVFNGGGELLFSGSLDGTLRFWYIDEPANNSTVDFDTGITSLALSPDRGTMAVGLITGDITLFDMNTGQSGITLTGAHFGQISALAFSPDGSLLISGAVDSGNVVAWDLSSEIISPDLIGTHDQPITGIAFSPDNTLIATSGEDDTIRLWGLSNSFG